MRVYQDSEGWLWLDAGEDELLCLDEPVGRRLREKYPTRPLASVEQEFGNLLLLEPRRS